MPPDQSLTGPAPLDLRGLWVPVVTPFTGTDEVDLRSLRHLADGLLGDGMAHGLVALGTTGEPATLTGRERQQVVDTCAEVCAERGRGLIIGLGTNNTRTTLEEAVRWNRSVPDATAVLVVVPYYTRPSPAGIVDHFRRVAETSTQPVIVYNVPYRTGRGLDAATLLELAAIDNIVGVKQAVGALDHDTLTVLAHRPPGFHVLAGDDAYIAPLVLLGGAGAIAASAHLRTDEFRALVTAALAGDAPTAAALAHELLATIDAGFAEPTPALWKAALHDRGVIASGAVRAPMTAATANATARLVATTIRPPAEARFTRSR